MSTAIMTEPPTTAIRQSRRPGPKPRPRLPCASCGDPGGALDNRGYPFRMKGERFGVEGMVCNRCRFALRAGGWHEGPEPDEPAEGSFDRRIALASLAKLSRCSVFAAMDAIERGGAA